MIKTKTLVNILRILWLLLILNNEYFIFWFSAKQCASVSAYHQSQMEGKFMLIADPQMTDDHSYKRHWVLMKATKFISGLYMKRNYRHLLKSLQPTDIFIMGDLMDSGRDWDNEFYAKEVARFQEIFPTFGIPTYNMTGNHDIGFGNGVSMDRLQRFEHHFGPTSYSFEKYGYEFIVLDTVSLSSDNPLVRQSALQVLNEPHSNTKPRILMSHVPLYRSSFQTCGPYRKQSRPIIREGAGYQYQNLMTKELSDRILNTIQPIAVFSGDDHDYCKVTHKYGDDGQTAVEITVPTFSMAQGLQYPGIMTLNVIPGGKSTTSLCWLPDQVGLFLRYASSLVFTVVVLFVWHIVQLKYSSESTKKNDDYLSKEEMGQAAFEQPRYVGSFIHSVKQVAWTSILVYIFCVLLL